MTEDGDATMDLVLLCKQHEVWMGVETHLERRSSLKVRIQWIVES